MAYYVTNKTYSFQNAAINERYVVRYFQRPNQIKSSGEISEPKFASDLFRMFVITYKKREAISVSRGHLRQSFLRFILLLQVLSVLLCRRLKKYECFKSVSPV